MLTARSAARKMKNPRLRGIIGGLSGSGAPRPSGAGSTRQPFGCCAGGGMPRCGVSGGESGGKNPMYSRELGGEGTELSRSSAVRWGDVVVQAEEVVRVIAALQPAEPLPGAARVGGAERLLRLLAHEADVASGAVLAEGLGGAVDPG